MPHHGARANRRQRLVASERRIRGKSHGYYRFMRIGPKEYLPHTTLMMPAQEGGFGDASLQLVGTVFGRLHLLGGLYAKQKKQMQDPASCMVENRSLHVAHMTEFVEWLSLSLKNQVDDLVQYFAEEHVTDSDTLATRVILLDHASLIPAGTSVAHVLHFFQTLDEALTVIQARKVVHGARRR